MGLIVSSPSPSVELVVVVEMAIGMSPRFHLSYIFSLPPPALLLLLKHILHRPGPELHPLLSGATASGE